MPTTSVFKSILNNHSELAIRLFKSQKAFYFPRLKDFDFPYILLAERYVPILDVLSSKDLLAMDSADFLETLKIDQAASPRCEGFKKAAHLLHNAGYPGTHGGESGKTGGESGKTAVSGHFPCLDIQGRSP